jgi:acyl carrier protein
MTSAKLDAAFRTALELDGDAEITGLKYRDIPQWDSIGHMALVAEIESAYDVMFSTDEVVALSSYDKAVELLRTHGINEL